MGLDDTLTELVWFQEALEGFRDVLQAGRVRRATIEQHLATVWDDAFSREFSRRRDELDAPVSRFADHEVETYLAFLDEKIHHLRGYLGDA